MSLPFFTIGHSTRSFEDFLELLREHRIEQVIDVRKLPGSRRHPQFNEGTLSDSLSTVGIAYERIKELTGRRPVSEDIAFEVNAFWNNRSFHNYADYALSTEFHRGLDRLLEIGTEHRTAIMCAEAVWWRCHRRLISDNLIAHAETVVHILSQDRADPASMTAGAVEHNNHTVTYPRD